MVGAGGGARLSREGYEDQQPGVAVDALSQRCRWASADGKDEERCARVHSVAQLPTERHFLAEDRVRSASSRYEPPRRAACVTLVMK